MATYTTNSGFSDLNGVCEISGLARDSVSSYTSSTLGPAKVKNLGSSESLNFRLKFDSGDIYVILATGGGSGYSGTASHTGSPDEPWAAGHR